MLRRRRDRLVRLDRSQVLAAAIDSLESRMLFATLPAGFTESLVGASITNATAMAFAPDGRLFVTQQTGALRVVDHGTLQATPFTTVTTTSAGERGLLGVAFDPDYFSNHYVYVYYTATSPAAHNRVSRFTADPNNQNVAVAGSETVLLDLNNLSSATNHNGGAIHFGPDNKLYIAVGENANRANAQSFGNLLGKMLRMSSDGTIPSDNPYINDAAVSGQNKLIWSLGLRNPFTFAFQRGTGRLFINDVGESTWEEINDGIAHSNYGWGFGSPTIEGFIGAQTPPANYRDPKFEYDHSAGQIAIIGGAFYNPVYNSYGASYDSKYFYGDYGAGYIRTLDFSGTPTASPFATGVSALSAMDIGPDGSIYYSQRGGTQGVYRIKANDTTAPTFNSPSFVFDEARPAFGTSQRFRVAFNEFVGNSVTASDLVLTNLTTGAVVPTANIAVQYDAANNTATFSFPGYVDANGLLPNGNYRATIANGAVSDLSGNTLASSLSFDFYQLQGDATRSRRVDSEDQDVINANFGKPNRTYSQGDLNYDGAVNAVDQAIYDANKTYWLPAPTGNAGITKTAGNDVYSFRFETTDPVLDIYTNGAGTGTPLWRVYYGSGAAQDIVTIGSDGGNDTAAFFGRPGVQDNATFDASPSLSQRINGLTIFPLGTNVTRTFDGAGGADILLVRTGANVGINTMQDLQSLTIQNNNTLLTAAPAISGGLAIRTGALSISQGKLDLNDGDLLVTGTAKSIVEGYVKSGFNFGGQNGATGIVSSIAKNNPTGNTTLGILAGQEFIDNNGGAFDGQPIMASDALLKYTYYGDVDFNGAVDSTDYNIIDFGFLTGATGWANGDVDFSNSIDSTDYNLIDFAFVSQSGVL